MLTFTWADVTRGNKPQDGNMVPFVRPRSNSSPTTPATPATSPPIHRRNSLGDNTLTTLIWSGLVCLLGKSTTKSEHHWTELHKRRVNTFHMYGNSNMYDNIATKKDWNPVFNEFLKRLVNPINCSQLKQGDNFMTWLEYTKEKYYYEVIQAPQVHNGVCYITFKQQKRHYVDLVVICTRYVEFSFKV